MHDSTLWCTASLPDMFTQYFWRVASSKVAEGGGSDLWGRSTMWQWGLGTSVPGFVVSNLQRVDHLGALDAACVQQVCILHAVKDNNPKADPQAAKYSSPARK